MTLPRNAFTTNPQTCAQPCKQQFYIKDGKWTKDNVEDTMNKAVYGISHKHFAELQEWDRDHPNWKEDENESGEYLDIANNEKDSSDGLKQSKTVE